MGNIRFANKMDNRGVLWLFVAILATIFIGEIGIMLAFEMLGVRGLVAVVLDPVLLALLATPMIYHFVVKPFKKNIQKLRAAERQSEVLISTLALKNEELQSIFYTASHDLRSPLVNIQGYGYELSFALKQLEDYLAKTASARHQNAQRLITINDDLNQSLLFIRKSTNKIDTLLNGLLKIARLGMQDIDLDKLDVNMIVYDVLESVRPKLNLAQAEVTIDDLPDCVGDTAQINQVFSNLITNAIKYLDPKRKGRLHISGHKKNGMSIYCVADNGIGIDRVCFEKIFEVFHRLNPRAHATGEGLGLTIVKRIVNRHNGRIWVESRPGQGSKFFISLPNSKHNIATRSIHTASLKNVS